MRGNRTCQGAALALLLAIASPATAQHVDPAAPAIASDGRVAVSIAGDLWVRAAAPDTAWMPITDGPAWDREPAWTGDGTALVFASDRDGGSALWRVAVTGGEPQRLTAGPWDAEPTVGPDGSIVFVRHRGPLARLWRRAPGGEESRVTKATAGAERSPAFSPDGTRLAYTVHRVDGAELVIRWLDGDSTVTPVRDRAVEYPAWSPAGERLSFNTRRGNIGVWVTDVRGTYVNLASTREAASAWLPDGARLVLVGLPPADPSYNGDPDRTGDRTIGNMFSRAGEIVVVAAPDPPDARLATLDVRPPTDRRAKNAEAFDRVWQRTAALYFGDPESAERRRQWEHVGERYRPRAAAARSEGELERVIHEMLRERPPLRVPAQGRAVVSSAHPVATEAGLEILRAGGNVVDAAVAVSFALGVVEPDASGIGGYGQMLIHSSGMTEPKLIEFMTRAPEEASLLSAAVLERGDYPDDGPVLANVPGTVAGMHLAWRKHGSGALTWERLLQPAIRAARDGFVVSDGLATTLARERDRYRKYESSRALFFRNDEPLHAGDTLRNPDLAWALEQIATGGADAFYKGIVGRRMVEDLRGKGNVMRMSDVERYFAVEREPVSGTYRGHTFYSSTPPSAGGATLAAQLNHLELLDRRRPYTEDAATLHGMIEAWKLTPAGFERIADPGLWPVTTTAFVSKDSARVRWRCFEAGRALAPDDLRGDSLPCAVEEPEEVTDDTRTGTTSFAVADASGNIVSVTQTLGTWGGNFYVTPGLGFLYNDKLTSYATNPDRYGARLPFARHGSSIAPTIVYRGEGAGRRPWFAAGAAGNRWITSAVYAIVTSIIDQDLDPQRAVELPRFLVSQRRTPAGREFVIELEDGFAPEVIAGLRERGHRIHFISLKGELRMGYAAAVKVDAGRALAGGDPRRSGTAGALPQ